MKADTRASLQKAAVVLQTEDVVSVNPVSHQCASITEGESIHPGEPDGRVGGHRVALFIKGYLC